MKSIILLFLLISTFFISCKKTLNSNINSKTEYELNNILEKYPQLKLDGKLLLIKTIKNEQYNFQILYFSNIDDTSQGIIIIETEDQTKAIPLFSNLYRNYWNFQNDKILRNIPKVDSNFQNELNKALENLNQDEVIAIINEIFKSLLHTKSIDDKIELENLKDNYAIDCNNEFPSENLDSTKVRINKNYSDLMKNWDLQKYSAFPIYEIDQQNHRIYQITYNQKSNLPHIKVYRFDSLTPCKE